jgi:hypothetical protein
MNLGIKKAQFLPIQHSLLEMLTPVQFLMKVLSYVGDPEAAANWAMVGHLMKLHLLPQVVLE